MSVDLGIAMWDYFKDMYRRMSEVETDYSQEKDILEDQVILEDDWDMARYSNVEDNDITVQDHHGGAGASTTRGVVGPSYEVGAGGLGHDDGQGHQCNKGGRPENDKKDNDLINKDNELINIWASNLFCRAAAEQDVGEGDPVREEHPGGAGHQGHDPDGAVYDKDIYFSVASAKENLGRWMVDAAAQDKGVAGGTNDTAHVRDGGGHGAVAIPLGAEPGNYGTNAITNTVDSGRNMEPDEQGGHLPLLEAEAGPAPGVQGGHDRVTDEGGGRQDHQRGEELHGAAAECDHVGGVRPGEQPEVGDKLRCVHAQGEVSGSRKYARGARRKRSSVDIAPGLVQSRITAYIQQFPNLGQEKPTPGLMKRKVGPDTVEVSRNSQKRLRPSE